MTPIENTVRSARILHSVFLTTVFLYVVILFQVHPTERAVPPVFVFAFASCGFANIGVAKFLRTRMVQSSEDQLRVNPDEIAALARWRTGIILSLTFAETIALFGLILKMLGVGWNLAGLFFAVSIFLMLAWTPRLDVSPS